MKPDSALARILIVEDEKDLRDLLIFEMEEEGYSAIAVCNGLEALEALRYHEIDVILSDLCMPGMSGTQLLQVLRASGFYKPFIVLSGFGTRAEAIELMRLGAMDFLDKPFDHKILKKVLSEAVTLSKALPALREEMIKSLGLVGVEPNSTQEKAILQLAHMKFIRSS